MKFPKHIFSRFLLPLMILMLGNISCKDLKENPVLPNNKVDFSKAVTLVNTDPKKKLGLVMRLPQIKMDISTFGLKNSQGYLNKVTQMFFSNPVTEEWFLVDFTGNYPSKITMNNGASVEFSNYNVKNSTVDVVVKDATGKVYKKGVADRLDTGVLPTFDLVANKLANKGGRLAAPTGDICDAIKDAAGFIGFLANAVGCIAGIAAIEASFGIATVLNGYSTAVACYNAISTLLNGLLGTPSPSASCSGFDVGNDLLTGGGGLLFTPGATKGAGGVSSIISTATDAIGCIPCEDDKPKSKAKSTGDPHINTFDGDYYSFQGHGEFIAVKSTTDNFEIQARQEDFKNTGVATLNTGVAVRTGNDVVCVLANPLRIYLNKVAISAGFSPKTLADGSILSQLNNDVKLETKAGDLVVIRASNSYLLDYLVSLNSTRVGKVKGLMGNFDGNFINDIALNDGKIIEYKFENLYPTYADSWRITQANSLFVYDTGKNTDTYTKRNFPAKPVVISDAQRLLAMNTCKNAGINTEPYLSNCIYDITVTGDASLANSSLWGQNYIASIPTQTVNSDVSYFQNVRLEVTNGTQSDETQLNLLDWRTGKVYALKDGATNADKIDIVSLVIAGNITLFTPGSLKFCGISCGVSSINQVLDKQKWATIRKGDIALKTSLAEEVPSNPDFIPLSKWSTIKSAADIKTLHSSINLDPNESLCFTYIVDSPNSGVAPVSPYSNSVFRFITQEGKKGAFIISGFGKIGTSEKYFVTLDIKIEK